MNKITLTDSLQGRVTLLDNRFIDSYMLEANGEFVKVYLLLLRYSNDPTKELTVSMIADILNYTENDVNRAINYWKSQGLIDIALASPVMEEKIEAPKKPAPEPKKEVPVNHDITQKQREEFQEVLFVAEQYLGKTLSKSDVDILTYLFDELNMSAELIEYLIEYCVENGHKSIHYIRSVALNCSERGISTSSQAKKEIPIYCKNYYVVLNAYGIKGRAPAAPEIEYIRRWIEEYKMDMDLIVEACNRTMNAIHQPKFEYTDTILKSWMEKGVRHIKDVAALDAQYQQAKEKGNKSRPAPQPVQPNPKNRFNNFEGRTYEDMDELTRKLIETQ